LIEVTADTYISAPREEIFPLAADLSLRLPFLDHYVDEYRLTRPRSEGVGAGVRHRVDAPFFTHYAETAIIELDPPRRIVEAGRAGRQGKIRTGTRWDFTREGSSHTRVVLLMWMDGGTQREQLKQRLGLRRWLRRQAKTSLERLRLIVEEPASEPLRRATIAGLEPEKAARWGG
jgi:Polyketide cyclase / dehydrase and lipid transport